MCKLDGSRMHKAAEGAKVLCAEAAVTIATIICTGLFQAQSLKTLTLRSS